MAPGCYDFLDKQRGIAVLLNGRTAILVLVGAWLSMAAQAANLQRNSYYPADFYHAVESGTVGQALKDEIFTVLSSGHVHEPGGDRLVGRCNTSGCDEHQNLGYNEARRILFGQLHLQQINGDYAIKDLYCEKLMTGKDFGHNKPGPNRIPDPNVLNAEHTWPQSRFVSGFNRGMQKSDLHILFPVQTDANSARGNMEFADVVSESGSPCPASKRGFTTDGSRKTFFEVPDNHKGNVARAIFYFATRYATRVGLEEESSLKAWHRLDPVDDAERARNEAIFGRQKVRNPYIDYPELVELISDF